MGDKSFETDYFSQFLPDLSLIIFMSHYHGCQL